MIAELWHVNERSELIRPVKRGLAGTTVSSLHKVEHFLEGSGMFLVVVANSFLNCGRFFVFAALSTRKERLFCLVFNLYELQGSESCVIIVLIVGWCLNVLRTSTSDPINSVPITRRTFPERPKTREKLFGFQTAVWTSGREKGQSGRMS